MTCNFSVSTTKSHFDVIHQSKACSSYSASDNSATLSHIINKTLEVKTTKIGDMGNVVNYLAQIQAVLSTLSSYLCTIWPCNCLSHYQLPVVFIYIKQQEYLLLYIVAFLRSHSFTLFFCKDRRGEISNKSIFYRFLVGFWFYFLSVFGRFCGVLSLKQET